MHWFYGNHSSDSPSNKDHEIFSSFPQTAIVKSRGWLDSNQCSSATDSISFRWELLCGNKSLFFWQEWSKRTSKSFLQRYPQLYGMLKKIFLLWNFIVFHPDFNNFLIALLVNNNLWYHRQLFRGWSGWRIKSKSWFFITYVSPPVKV